MSEDKNQYDASRRVAYLAAKRLRPVDISVTAHGEKENVLNYLRMHPEHAVLIATELDKLIASYNRIQIGPTNKDLLKCTVKLKEFIPQLPLLKDIMSDANDTASALNWRIAYLTAIRTSLARIQLGNKLGEGMDEDQLMDLDKDPDVYVHQLFDTHPKAMLLAVAYHLYEDAVNSSPQLMGKVPSKDDVTNALIEMLVLEHSDSPLFSITGNAASDDEDGGLDWIDFECFTDEFRDLFRQRR